MLTILVLVLAGSGSPDHRAVWGRQTGGQAERGRGGTVMHTH